MANFKSKATAQTEITKTEFWLNVKLPAGNIGINLATGINQHEVYLELIEKYGVEKCNKWLESKGAEAYITQEGVKASTADKFADEFASL